MSWSLFWNAAGAIASSAASIIALWVACTEYSRQDKYRQKKIELQKCDLILIPTKEWGSGAHYQRLIDELTGRSKINEAANYAKGHSSIADYFHPNETVEIMNNMAQQACKNSISARYFKGSIALIPPSELFWLDEERIYGVNIKDGLRGSQVRHALIVTQYFKDVIITQQGKKHDKS